MTEKDKKTAKLTTKSHQAHPLVRFNYMPRVIGFSLHGLILTSIFYESRNVLLWSAIFLMVFAWPHIAYLHGKYSRDPIKAEYRNLYFEAFLCGLWMNLVSFQLWPSTVFLIGAVINLLATRGLILFRNALFFLISGGLFTGLFNGFHYIPESSQATAYACIFFIAIYTSIVAFLSFKTSRKLSVSKQGTEAILRSVQSGVLVIDVETHKIIEVNPAAARMFGVAAYEIIGHVCHQFICPAEEGACPITDKKQRLDNSERVLLNKDGDEIPILKTVVPFILEGRECLLESFIDISERKQMEEKLRRLARAVEQSIDGIAVADMDGNIEFVNSAWAQMHGYKTEELTGKHLKIFHTTEQFHTDVNTFNDQVMKNGSHQGEVGHVRKDGSVFPTWMTTTLLKDEENRPIGLLGIARDITDRKQAEAELRTTLEKVESVNVHLEKQTALAKEMAEKAEAANVAKSQFLANMSHEIRTPMNAVVGMAHLLTDTELSGEKQRFSEIFQQSADSLLNVINDILDYSKIEAGKLDLEIIEFDLIQLLEEINGMMGIEAR
ncbi:MAG: PAS domain S-box protein, partial [Spirochaetales bacterium]|nr:PAS domain S-box protein [Spirochaetales bacterium]